MILNPHARLVWSIFALTALLAIAWPVTVVAQDTTPESPETTDSEEEAPTAPVKVDVEPVADDVDISDRLTRILEATERFEDPEVDVDEGVVFLSGRTKKEEFRTWAGDLARNTESVVAVVNRIEVVAGSVWDLTPAWNELRKMARKTVQTAPLILLAIVLLVVTWFAAKLAVRFAGWAFRNSIPNGLLRQVATRAVAIPVFLMGLYLVLRISGLTQMAATVVGGTGLIGLVIGIAFRDIAENFLASVLISMQRPFAIGDLVEIEQHKGFVQSVTTRGTLLMTLDGNHVQIPNSTIYKTVIYNFTANPSLRLNFIVGIGYEDSVTEAQEVALRVLTDHPAVLSDPEPLVLVEELGAATVNLHVYFWINGHEHSALKARSSVVRLVKRAFEKAGISMPDESREVVFPKGVPVNMLENGKQASAIAPEPSDDRRHDRSHEDDQVSTTAEGNLTSEASEINEQAERSRRPDEGANLLEDEPEPAGAKV